MDQIVKITKTTKTTADGLAACFGLTRPRIVQLAKENVLVRDENSKLRANPGNKYIKT